MADDTKTGTGGPEDTSNAHAKAPGNIADEVGLPTRPLTPDTPPPPPSGNLESDMVRIIEDVKLPERTIFRAIGDIPAKKIDTALVLPPEEQNVEAPQTHEVGPRDPMAAVHTFKDDLQTVVHEKKISLVQAAALESDKRAHIIHTTSDDGFRKPRPRILGTLVIVGILILLGGVILGAVFLIVRDRLGITENSFVVEGLLFSEQDIPFSIQGYSATELKRLLIETRSSASLTLGAITRLTPVVQRTSDTGASVESAATTREFLTSIGAHAPEELLRALGSEFFFGFHTVDENAPMLIVPVTSYERAFAGMLAWESSMNIDLAPIFTTVPPLIRQADGLLIKREFEDAVMRNYDVRALKDDSGTVQLYYSFPTRELLIISESPYSFAEILARLRADRRL